MTSNDLLRAAAGALRRTVDEDAITPIDTRAHILERLRTRRRRRQQLHALLLVAVSFLTATAVWAGTTGRVPRLLHVMMESVRRVSSFTRPRARAPHGARVAAAERASAEVAPPAPVAAEAVPAEPSGPSLTDLLLDAPESPPAATASAVAASTIETPHTAPSLPATPPRAAAHASSSPLAASSARHAAHLATPRALPLPSGPESVAVPSLPSSATQVAGAQEPTAADPVATPAAAAASPAAPAPAMAPALNKPDLREEALFKRAQQAHFVARDAAAALAGWDEYLRVQPNGRYAPEAEYNRAMCLVRLHRNAEAVAALQPFANGDHGSYRRREARSLIEAIHKAAH